MKKIFSFACAAAVVSLATACGGNKADNANEALDKTKAAAQAAVKATKDAAENAAKDAAADEKAKALREAMKNRNKKSE